MLRFDVTHALPFLPQDWLTGRLAPLAQAQEQLLKGSGAGGEFTGWVGLPAAVDQAQQTALERAARTIRDQSRVLVVIGIGGSYLGARAMLELLTSPHYNLLCRETPQIFFAGNTLSPDAVTELLDYVAERDFSLNVVSKSGGTTEPAAAFLLFRQLLEKKYGKEGARRRIFVTTDPQAGSLRTWADQAGCTTFAIPPDIGGRYSVLTPAGLLPLAAAGVDIGQMLSGAVQAQQTLSRPGPDNPAWQYAAARQALYAGGKAIELLACYEPHFRFFGEWWKQLFGESEGKGGQGIFPASAEFSADLHSMGQYIQEGSRNLFETVVRFARARTPCPLTPQPGEELAFLQGQDLHHVNEQARRGTLLAHVAGGVPNLLLTAGERTPYWAGQLVYFFQFACGLSGYLSGVNPFDQPGVEAYKANMFALLGKPGHEARRQALADQGLV